MPVRASMQQYRTHRDQTSFRRCYSGSRPNRGSPGCAAQRQQQLVLQFLLHLQATCGQLREKLPRLGDVVLIDQLRPQRRHSFPQHLWAWQGGSPKHRAGWARSCFMPCLSAVRMDPKLQWGWQCWANPPGQFLSAIGKHKEVPFVAFRLSFR